MTDKLIAVSNDALYDLSAMLGCISTQAKEIAVRMSKQT